MAARATRIETQVGRSLTPGEIFEITRARETSLSRLLMLYIATGLVFMLLPGTFLGVWNLLAISSRHAANSVSAGWIQAHGHAQIFGWIGTFILGIGFYSIPKLRRMNPFALRAAWVCWVLWTLGVSLRWLTGVYEWQWRVVLPVSAALELLAFAIFFHSVSGHRPQDSGKQKLDEWVGVVIVARRRPAAYAACQLGRSLFSRVSRRFAGSSNRIRPAVPGARDLGFPCSLRLGIQCQMAAGFSGIARGTRARAALGSRSELCGCDCGNDGLDETGCALAIGRDHRRGLGPPLLRAHTATGQGEGSACDLSGICALGVRLGHHRGRTGNLGQFGRGLSRHLGCIAPRIDRGLFGHHGFQRGPENSAGIFRNAFALQHQIDVSFTAAAGDRVPTFVLAPRSSHIKASRDGHGHGSRCRLS